MTVVGSGKYTYEVQQDWFELPEGWRFGQGEGRVCLQCHRPGDAALEGTVP